MLKQLLENRLKTEEFARQSIRIELQKQIEQYKDTPLNFTKVTNIYADVISTEERVTHSDYYEIVSLAYLAIETDNGEFLVRITGDFGKAAFYSFNEFELPNLTPEAAQILYETLVNENPNEICETHGLLTGLQIRFNWISANDVYEKDVCIDWNEEIDRLNPDN